MTTSIDTLRRRLLWHGALFLLIALLLGFPTAAAPHGRAWLAAHLTMLFAAAITLCCGLLWTDLRLGAGQRTWAFRLLLAGMYTSLVANVFASLVDLPGPATRPGLTAPAWQTGVFTAMLVVLIPSLLIAAGLVLHGLRGRAAE